MTQSAAQMLLPLAYGLAFLIYLVTWSLLFAQQRSEPANRALRLFLVNVMLWVAADFILLLPVSLGYETSISRFSSLLWMPSTIYALLFFHRLTDRPLGPVFHLVTALIATGVALHLFTDLGVVGTRREGWMTIIVRGPWSPLFILLHVLPAMLSVRLLSAEIRSGGDQRRRRALLLIMFAGLLGLFTGLFVTSVLPLFLDRLELPRLASMAMVPAVLCIQHAMMRLGFLSFDVDGAAEELFEDLRDAVVLVDPEGRPRRMNAAARALLDGVPPDVRERHLELLLAGNEESRGRELAWPGADGGRILQVGSSVARRRGVPVGRLVLIRDLTEHRRADEVLRHSRDELERAAAERARDLRQSQKMEAVGILASGIAHDLNNLLAAMIGFAGAARDDLPEGHAIRADLDDVLGAARRARDLVGGLLAFTREQPAERRDIDLRQATGEAVRLMATSLPAGVSIDLRPAEDEVVVSADAAQIHQVVMNLVSNAIQAIRERGGAIQVAVSRATGPDREALLTVTDDGPGMSREVADTAFAPFFTTRGQAGGSGLGLATVAHIVKGHGGSVALDSGPGRGTAVEVRLPLAPRNETAARAPSLPPAGGTERVLFVDDKPRVVRAVCRMLRPLGYDVAAFDSPEGALAAFVAAPDTFDLLLTDLAMPGMSGLDLAERILGIRPDLPVVVMTGNAEDAARVRGAAAGVREIVEKPLDRSGLDDVLRRVLDSRGVAGETG